MKLKSSKPVQVRELSLPAPAPPIKRGRGRPRKNEVSDLVSPKQLLEKGGDVDQGRELMVFRRALADQEKANMTPVEFDGGGTSESAHAVTKDSLLRRVTRRLNVLDRFLTDDKLIELLAFSSLKEIGIYEGIMLDKSLVLQGQPTVIIGNDDRRNFGDKLQRLTEEMKRRGLIPQSAQPRVINP